MAVKKLKFFFSFSFDDFFICCSHFTLEKGQIVFYEIYVLALNAIP